MTTQYQNLLREILGGGVGKGDRTGTGTRSLFGAQIRFDLQWGFPLLTTKRVPFRLVAEELLWMLSGSTDARVLQDKKVKIWNEWATKEKCAEFGRKEGDLGPIYGHVWRNFGATSLPTTRLNGVGRSLYDDDGVDQIANALNLLQSNPDSRRIIVSAWDPKEATNVALPPCHSFFQFGTSMQDGRFGVRRHLSCHMVMRSADVFLGVPFNIASYALLTHLFADVLGYEVGTLTVSFGDVHIYNNHQAQVEELLMREPRSLPRLVIQRGERMLDCSDGSSIPLARLTSFTRDDLKLEGYKPHPAIKAEVSV
jgi:thymidylate synthase